MPKTPPPANELERLEAVRLCTALGPSQEPAFDKITGLAARATAARATAPKSGRGRARCSIVAVLLCGFLITAILAHLNRVALNNQAIQRYERLSERVMFEATRRANLVVYGLRGARGVFAADPQVGREAFARYVASRDLPSEFPGATGFGFMQRVARARADAFQADERADNASESTVHPAPQIAAASGDLYVTKFIDPIQANRELSALDAGSDPVWTTAIDKCVDTGNSAITDCFMLTLAGKSHAAYAYFVPVYRFGSIHQTADQRRQQLIGVLFAPVLVDQAMASIADAAQGLLSATVFDGGPDGRRKLIFQSQNQDGKPTSTINVNQPSSLFLASDQPTTICGHPWIIRTATTNKFDESFDQSGPRTIACCGSLLSVFVAAMVRLLVAGRNRALDLASNMTAGLNEAMARAQATSQDLIDKSMLLKRTGEMAKVGGWELDVRTRKVTWTEQVYRIHEVPLGTTISVEQAISFYAPEARAAIEDAVQQAIISHMPWDLELPLITAAGNRIWVRAQGEPIIADNDVIKLCGAFQDITERKEAVEQLRCSATHDKLTGLPNRALLHDRLQQCIRRSQRYPDRHFAVLFLDFDRFKLTNDTLGHEAGDELLKTIADRLRASLRPADSVALNQELSMAGRLGGDEFVVILDELRTPADAQTVAERLLETFAEPYRIAGHQVISTASIGIVASSNTYSAADEMLRDADTAMYEAKIAGKGRYVLFDVAMRQRVEGVTNTEAELRRALQEGQFFLVYQPIVSLTDGSIQGVEALIRWNHPVRGLVAPAQFIPIAEDSGLILPIGEWVLRQACAQFMHWRETLGEIAPRSISVNLSRKQLAVSDLPMMIKGILDECGMPPECLHLEVTETAAMKDIAASTSMLAAIKAIGVKLDMDDFGTGHSSLASLHQFPIDVLKIDRSFIKNIERGRDFSAMVHAIVQLARNLNIRVIAEGIETAEQALFLSSLDCDFGQGYLFSKPLLPDEVGAFVAKAITLRGLFTSASAAAAA